MNQPSFLRLFRVEMARAARRRATRVVGVGVLAMLVLSGVRVFLGADASPPDLQAAETAAAVQTAECRASVTSDGFAWTDEQLDGMCYVDPAWLVVDTAFHLQSVLGGSGQQPWSDVRAAAVDRPVYDSMVEGEAERESPASGFGGELATLATLMGFVAAGLGATLIGADWRSGVIESHAIWVPNRRRLLAAKLAAAGTTGAALSLATSAGFLAVVMPAVVWRGDAAFTGVGFAADVLATIGRGAVAAGFFALLAGSIATVARTTAAGMVVLFGWSIAGAIAADNLSPRVAYLAPYANLRAFVVQGDVSYMETIRLPGGGLETLMQVSHGWSTAGVAAALLTVALTLGAESRFARRDIS